MKTIGSQKRENIYEAGYEAVTLTANTVTLKDLETGKLELWGLNDHFAGYVVEFAGNGYEFITSL